MEKCGIREVPVALFRRESGKVKETLTQGTSRSAKTGFASHWKENPNRKPPSAGGHGGAAWGLMTITLICY